MLIIHLLSVLGEYIHNQQLPSLIYVFTELLGMHPVTFKFNSFVIYFKLNVLV